MLYGCFNRQVGWTYIYCIWYIYIYTKYYYTNITPMINEQLDWYWYLRSHCGHGLWVVGEHQWLAPQNLCKCSPNQLNIWLFSRGIYDLPWISGHAYLCKPNTYTLYIFFSTLLSGASHAAAEHLNSGSVHHTTQSGPYASPKSLLVIETHISRKADGTCCSVSIADCDWMAVKNADAIAAHIAGGYSFNPAVL